MKREYYSEFVGLELSKNQVDAPQVSFLKLDNYNPNRVQGALIKRGGSTEWATTGSVYGLGAYGKSGASYLTPLVEHIWRHRRVGLTSSIERLDTTTDTWTTCSLGANTAFGVNGVTQFDQIGEMMILCGGRPAFTLDITSSAINRLGGPFPTTAPTWTLGGGSLSGETMGFYTFYNSTTGWESSPSPVTALTTLASQQINWSAMETSCAKEGVDQKRLYRTQLGASGKPPYYRVATIPLANATYTDTTNDTTLTTGGFGPDFADNNPPPLDSYICTAYANRFWVASGNEVWFSKTFDGDYAKLEHFSPDRVFRFPFRVTGLVYSPAFGRLLVFLPPGRGIWYISGTDLETFQQDLFNRAEGTNFPASISYHEEFVCFWGNRGPTIITPQGVVTNFGQSLAEFLRNSATKVWNGEVWIWSRYHPLEKGFIFGYSLTDTATSEWEDATSGLLVGWEDAVNGNEVEWQ